MSATRALVLRAAGINCDGETVRALELAGARTDLVHLERVLEDPARLDAFSLLVLPGGFSYGDDVAAGRIFGFELRHGLARELRAFVARGGFVLGVCNGFQVLVDTGLLEVDAGARTIALANNKSARFECRWITLRAEKSACPWLVAGEVFPAPIAHGEGRLMVRDAAALARLERNGQVALRYVREDGTSARGFPDNPNDSVADIAGLCDSTGRVLGLMPHPERNLSPWNHPHWTRLPARAEGEGLSFYRRLVDAASLAPV
ncbi:MAG TPA: phosphoribosylformylglycinamidine synthase I [Planctomycetota bacterium]|jgi:phosphoribosylformylglycinamidine synthase|nr:phosphoribosylformylglycinamidine synthase I [Planctomycetota bacterium]